MSLDVKKPSLVGLPEVLAPASAAKIWILFYRTHVVGIQFKCFLLDGTQGAAYVKGQEHCKNMGYRFMSVTPLFSDLAADEEVHSRKEKAS